MLKRLTTDNPKDNIQIALNLFYIKDGWTWVRGGGPMPEYCDVSLCDYVRSIAKDYTLDADVPGDDNELSDLMAEWLLEGSDSTEGLIATIYAAGWAFAELRHRLKTYEDTGLEPEEIIDRLAKEKVAGMFGQEAEKALDKLMEYQKDEQEGRLVVLPCKVGDTLYDVTLGEIQEKTVVSIALLVSQSVSHLTLNVQNKRGAITQVAPWQFNKTVFLTRKEAEAALEGGIKHGN